MHKYSTRLKVHLRVNTLPHFQCWCSFVTAETIGRGRGSGQRIRNSALQHATGAVPSTRAITGRRRGSWTDAAMVTIYGARSNAEAMIARIRRMHDEVADDASR